MAVNPTPSSLITGSFILAASFFVLTGNAAAETGRYTMTPTKDGVLKLDTKTGAVSLCSRLAGSWQCKSVEGNGLGNKDRIKQLEEENARLRTQLEDQQLAPAPRNDGKMEMPSEEDVDKAMDFMEKLLHRFKGMVEDLKKDEKSEKGVPM